MDQFKFIIKNNLQKSFNTFFLFLFFLHAIAISFVVIKNNTANNLTLFFAIFILLVIFSSAYYFSKNFSSKNSYQYIAFLLMDLFWVMQKAYLMAIIILIAIAIAYVILKTKNAVIFTNQSICIKTFIFKKLYQWNKVEYIILKDNLLTINFKNNSFFQQQIADDDFELTSDFNTFCLQQIKLANN